MGSEKRNRHVRRLPLAQPPVNPKHLHLRLLRQTVAGLALHRRDAETYHRSDFLEAVIQELLVRSVPRLGHRAINSNTCASDLEVTHTPKPLFELVRAPATEPQVRVTIDETRHDDTPSRTVYLLRMILRRHPGFRTYPFYDSILPGNRCISNWMDIGLRAFRAAACKHRYVLENGHSQRGYRMGPICRAMASCSAAERMILRQGVRSSWKR